MYKLSHRRANLSHSLTRSSGSSAVETGKGLLSFKWLALGDA